MAALDTLQNWKARNITPVAGASKDNNAVQNLRNRLAQVTSEAEAQQKSSAKRSSTLSPVQAQTTQPAQSGSPQQALESWKNRNGVGPTLAEQGRDSSARRETKSRATYNTPEYGDVLRDQYYTAFEDLSSAAGSGTMEEYEKAQRSYEQAESLLTQWESNYKDYQKEQEKRAKEAAEQAQLDSYISLFSNPDFAQLSQYKSTQNGSDFGDRTYDYINKNEDAIGQQMVLDASSGAGFLGSGYDVYKEMTDDEIALFNYIYATEGKDAAYDFTDFIFSDLTARQRLRNTEAAAEYAQEHPVKASVFSILTSPLRGLSYIGQLGDYGADGEIDQNAGYNKFSYLNSATRAEIADTIKNSGKWGDVGSFLYQTGMSMGDFLFNTLITGGFAPGSAASGISSKLALAIMGTGAAADATIEAKDRGLSDGQAFALGTIAGAAEYITEKVSLDTLLDKTSLTKNALGYFLKNTIAEGSEEVGSDLINLMADVLISKDKSEWQTSVDAYKAEGMSEKDAFWHAVLDQAKTMGLDFLGGALSGGVMSGGAVAINALQNRGSSQQATTAPQSARDGGNTPAMAQGQNTGTQDLNSREGGALPSAEADSNVSDLLTSAEAVGGNSYGPLQVNSVDSAYNGIYTGSRNGGAEYVGADQLYGASGEGVRAGRYGDGYDSLAADGAVQNGRGNLQVPGVVLLSPEAQNILTQRGVVNVELQEYSGDNAAFSAALDAARAADTANGWAVTPKTARELDEAGTRTFMDDAGSTGFAIAPDGDIEAVFANRSAGAPKGATKSTIPQAIANGGTKLDCYGEGLADLYRRYGFVPVARVKFNPEYANPGWDSSKKTPDIYFMLHNGDSADTVVQNMGQYKQWTKEELDALPEMEYDEAYAYRDSLLAQRQGESSGSSGSSGGGMGAARSGELGQFTQWQNATPAQGFHPVNEAAQQVTRENRGRAPVEVPRVNLEGRLTSKTASTLANANITTNEFAGVLENELAQGNFSRMAYTDAQATEAAEAYIRREGWQAALEQYHRDVGAGKVSKEITARGIALYNNAVNSGDAVSALNILHDFIENQKNAAQATQAVNILNKLGPEAQLYEISKSVEKLQAELQKKFPDITVEIDPAAAQAFLDAKTDAERAAARDALWQNVADQVPATAADKINAWRYLSMLFNARTHVRNVFGNVGFMPLRMMKNAIGAGLESAFNIKNRTKSILNPASAADRALLQAAWADYAANEDIIQSGGKYDDARSEVAQRRTIFKLKPLEALRRWNSNALDVEDTWFSKPAYAESLASYLKANKISAADFLNGNISTRRLTAAREYAIKEAQKATYRDVNEFSQFVSRLNPRGTGKVSKAASTLVSGVLPFKKTPANILVRGIEYSPLNLLRDIKHALYDVRRGNITPAEAIDSFASTLTGTGIMALGALMRSLGLITGGGTGDDEQDAFNDLRGGQDYALDLGDISITLDWLAPTSLPFFTGAAMYDAFTDRDGSGFAGFLDATRDISEPMLEMSMLQSVDDLLDSISYSDGKMSNILASAAMSYLGQFVPTILGQANRAFLEDTRQAVYTDKEGDLPDDIQYLMAQIAGKIPGLDLLGIDDMRGDYIDAWGRTEDTGSLAERAFNNFLNPAYVSHDTSTPVDDELQRLYDAGYGGVFPERASRSTKVDGEYLDADEYILYQTTMGQSNLDMISELLDSDVYKDLTDQQRADAISLIKQYSTDKAKREVTEEARGGKYESNWDDEEEIRDLAEYLGYKAGLDDAVGRSDYDSIDLLIEAAMDEGGDLRSAVLSNVSKADDLAEAAEVGIGSKQWLSFTDAIGDMSADKDENGNSISGSKKAKVVDYISGLNLTPEQKDYLYLSQGYSESGLSEVPW